MYYWLFHVNVKLAGIAAPIYGDFGADVLEPLLTYELVKAKIKLTHSDFLHLKNLYRVINESEDKKIQNLISGKVGMCYSRLQTSITNAYLFCESKQTSVIDDVELLNKKNIETFIHKDSEYRKKIDSIRDDEKNQELLNNIDNDFPEQNIAEDNLNKTSINKSLAEFNRYIELQKNMFCLENDLRDQLKTLITAKCSLDSKQSTLIVRNIVENSFCLDFNKGLYPLLPNASNNDFGRTVSVKKSIDNNEIDIKKDKQKCMQMSIAELCLDANIGGKSTKLLKRLQAVTTLNKSLSEDFIITPKIEEKFNNAIDLLHNSLK